MKRPNGQVAGHRCDDRLPKADGNVEERRDATKAIIQKEYGPPDVLELGDIERPEIGDGEVLVRVRGTPCCGVVMMSVALEGEGGCSVSGESLEVSDRLAALCEQAKAGVP